MTRIAVVDYGIGNLHSAHKSLVHVGADAVLTADPDDVASAAAVVVPGVGAFGACMTALRDRGLEPPVLEVAAAGRPVFGICVGMQMLFDASDESPGVAGLGLVGGTVRWLPDGVKRPQMQWNRLDVRAPDDPLFAGLDAPWCYFANSLAAVPSDPAVVTATVDYGGPITAAVRSGNVAAMQCHPEKSSRHGLALLANLVRSVEEAT